MIKKILTAILLLPTLLYAQINTERVMTIARNALYFEDYVLSIQYFNQVINAKPYLYEPYFFRGLAKINLDDYQGAESDCDAAIQRNPFVVRLEELKANILASKERNGEKRRFLFAFRSGIPLKEHLERYLDTPSVKQRLKDLRERMQKKEK